MPKSRMPRSFGLTLRALRVRNGLQLDEFTDILRPYTDRFRPPRTKFSADTVQKAEHSSEAHYWLLDAYAKWSGYPAGFIYLLSRVSCHLRDGEVENVKNLSVSLRKFADSMEHIASEVGLAAFQPNVSDSEQGRKDRADDELDQTAYDAVIRYQQTLPRSHAEYKRTVKQSSSQEIKYVDSQQIIDDARQVRIILEILQNLPRLNFNSDLAPVAAK